MYASLADTIPFTGIIFIIWPISCNIFTKLTQYASQIDTVIFNDTKDYKYIYLYTYL